MKKALKLFLPTAEAIQRLLYPYAEVVVHDIAKNRIIAIYHPFSKRKVGSSSLFTPEEEMASLEVCVGPYEKINWDGRKLKSVSSIIRDEQGKAVGLLCINLDISVLLHIQQGMMHFLEYQHSMIQPEPLFKDDWQERLNQYVHHYLNEHHLNLNALNRTEKRALIEHLHGMGAFTGKHAAHYLAQILKVSRATVYNYLSQSTKD